MTRMMPISQGVDQSKLAFTDYYLAGAMTGFAAAFTESPIDFFKSQIQVQIIRAKSDPAYKVKDLHLECSALHCTRT